MTLDRSFENFVRILSKDEVTPEIAPSALADISKEFFLRSIVAVVSFKADSDKAGEPDTIIPLFGPVPENEEPTYKFRSNMSGERSIVYHVFLAGDKRLADEDYRYFTMIMDILS